MAKPEQSPYICWIDLECTGSGDEDSIIEVGAVLTDRDFTELDYYHAVVGVDIKKYKIDPFVVDMHTRNDLLHDVIFNGVPIEQVDAEMVEWIRLFTKGDHIPLGGSGVSHYDRKYIKRELPEFDKYLTYWAYDVGSLRRYLRLFGFEIPDRKEGLNHRALDDIRDHIEEAKQYRNTLRDLLAGPQSDVQKRIYRSIHDAGRQVLGEMSGLDSSGTPI
jgi:oligoribonuclease